MAYAADNLRDYDPDFQFSHGLNPNSARSLFQQNEVHRLLRLLLSKDYISPFLVISALPPLAPFRQLAMTNRLCACIVLDARERAWAI